MSNGKYCDVTKAENFKRANEQSPVVYASVDQDGVTYRLRDGNKFTLGAKVARAVGVPRFAHLEECHG